ncbi:MAG: 4-hydroxy-3-methylbut-2-enyl diphosphate reductase, partial [Oscillibacter sp.]|nr:4-hydroxy-3-methylbut-2-enyl diphosphate reductase [Oscillibacter sp.]
MKVLLAQSAGFCYGVQRAVDLAKETARHTNGCYMLGDLIHNSHVISELAELGVRKIADAAALFAGDTVIIRSHGERRDVLDALEARGVACVNATCPNVLRIQKLVSEAETEGRQVVLIGERQHPEVIATASWCRAPLVFESADEVRAWTQSAGFDRDRPVTAVAQTTCIREIFETSCEILKKECTNAKIFDTICLATHKRQSEAAHIAAEA